MYLIGYMLAASSVEADAQIIRGFFASRSTTRPPSGHRFGRQPLENKQIEFRCRADEACQQRVDLAAVVGLVVEPMRQRRGQLLLELFRRRNAAVLDGPLDTPVVEPLDKIDDPPVLGFARGTEFVEGLEQDRIEPVRRRALAGKALHPGSGPSPADD